MPMDPKAGPICARDVAATVASIVHPLTATQPSIAAAQPKHTGELNSVFLAISNGQRAQTNLRYHDEATTSTWDLRLELLRCP